MLAEFVRKIFLFHAQIRNSIERERKDVFFNTQEKSASEYAYK